MLNKIKIVLIFMMLQGCLPIVKKGYPTLNVTIVDQSNNVVDQVTVVRNITQFEGKITHFSEIKETQNGQVLFNGKYYWRAVPESLTLLKFTWSLCVYKYGYERVLYKMPQKTNLKTQSILIHLKPIEEDTIEPTTCLWKKNR